MATKKPTQKIHKEVKKVRRGKKLPKGICPVCQASPVDQDKPHWHYDSGKLSVCYHGK